MTERGPDTDERDDPAGPPTPGRGNLTDKSATPGTEDPGRPTAVPGAYEADEADRERGRAAKPGN